MQFLFASGQVSVFGDICQQRIGASLHYYYFIYLFFCILPFSVWVSWRRKLCLVCLFFACFAFFVKVRSHWLGCWGFCGVVRLYPVATSHLCWSGVEMGWACAASWGSRRLSWSVWAFILQVILFFLIFFFLGVTTMRVVLVFFCVCITIFISHVLTLCRCVVSSFSRVSLSVNVFDGTFFSRIKSLIDWLTISTMFLILIAWSGIPLTPNSFQLKNVSVGRVVFSHASLSSLFNTVTRETAPFIMSAY